MIKNLIEMNYKKLVFSIIYIVGIIYTLLSSYTAFTLTDMNYTELIFGLFLMSIFIYGLVSTTRNKKGEIKYLLKVFLRVVFLVIIYASIVNGLLAYYDSNEDLKWIIYIIVVVIMMLIGILFTFIDNSKQK